MVQTFRGIEEERGKNQDTEDESLDLAPSMSLTEY